VIERHEILIASVAEGDVVTYWSRKRKQVRTGRVVLVRPRKHTLKVEHARGFNEEIDPADVRRVEREGPPPLTEAQAAALKHTLDGIDACLDLLASDEKAPPAVHPFKAAVEAALSRGGVLKGDLCDALGRGSRPAWFTEIMGRVERGTATIDEIGSIAVVCAKHDPEATRRARYLRDLVLLAFDFGTYQ